MENIKNLYWLTYRYIYWQLVFKGLINFFIYGNEVWTEFLDDIHASDCCIRLYSDAVLSRLLTEQLNYTLTHYTALK